MLMPTRERIQYTAGVIRQTLRSIHQSRNPDLNHGSLLVEVRHAGRRMLSLSAIQLFKCVLYVLLLLLPHINPGQAKWPQMGTFRRLLKQILYKPDALQVAQPTVLNIFSTHCYQQTRELKTDHGHMMPPLLHVCKGLACPADKSTMAWDTGTIGKTLAQWDTVKTCAVHSLQSNKQNTRKASKLSHSLQHQRAVLISDDVGLEPTASIHSSLRPGALGHVGGRPHLSPHVLPFTSVTHFYMGYYSFYRPRKDKRLSRPSRGIKINMGTH